MFNKQVCVFQVIEQVQTGKILSRPRGCPEDIHDIMVGCWRRNPGDRIQMRDIHQTLTSLRKDHHDYLELLS